MEERLECREWIEPLYSEGSIGLRYGGVDCLLPMDWYRSSDVLKTWGAE